MFSKVWNYGLEVGQTFRRLSYDPASPCLGLCEHAPAALIDDKPANDIDLNSIQLDTGLPSSLVNSSSPLLTTNCGHGTTNLERYGEYSAFLKSLRMSPDEVIKEIKASGLVGRGAAFQTGVK
jgi:NADH-quinone oxidoreductase subunit F